MQLQSSILYVPVFALFLFGCEVEELQDPARTAEPMTPPVALMDEGPDEHLTYLPDEIAWEDGPASFEEGSQMAILEGNPDEEGVFTMRFKLPDGFVIAPHWHPNIERVTVLSGVFHLGSGVTVDPEAAQPLNTGAYTSMPREMVHYAIAEGETIIQLTSVGPWVINYVHPDDDPRRLTD